MEPHVVSKEVTKSCTNKDHHQLDSNLLGAEGARRLVEVLLQCASLDHRNIGSNLLGDEGMAILGSCLFEILSQIR